MFCLCGCQNENGPSQNEMSGTTQTYSEGEYTGLWTHTEYQDSYSVVVFDQQGDKISFEITAVRGYGGQIATSRVADVQLVNGEGTFEFVDSFGNSGNCKITISQNILSLKYDTNEPYQGNWCIDAGEGSYKKSKKLSEFDTTNIYECNIVCANSDFEISYDLKVTYVKNDGWNFSGYEIAKASSKMKSEIPEERILDDISTQFAKDGKTVNIVDGSVSQTLNDGSIGCKATATGELVKGILTEKCTINISYSFSDKWNIYVTYNRDSYEWNVQALAGKKWIVIYKYNEGDFIYIESVDEANSTMMVGYRKGLYSSTIDGPLEEHGKPIKCKYKLEEDCIKIMTGDFTLEISPEMGTLMSGYTTYPEN